VLESGARAPRAWLRWGFVGTTDAAVPLVVSVSPRLSALARPLSRALPEARVEVGVTNATSIVIIAVSDEPPIVPLDRRDPAPDVIVVDPHRHRAHAAIDLLNAGAAAFISDPSIEVLAASIRSIALRRELNDGRNRT
jgi:hypothetical protein